MTEPSVASSDATNIQTSITVEDDQVVINGTKWWSTGLGHPEAKLAVVLGLSDDQVFNNIQKYGNTTAASIPIALCEAWEAGKIKEGDLVCLAAFGAGFTWGSSLIRWS